MFVIVCFDLFPLELIDVGMPGGFTTVAYHSIRLFVASCFRKYENRVATYCVALRIFILNILFILSSE